MMKPKRYHPLLMLFDVWGFVKNVFFLVIILFVLNYQSQSFLFKYGRYAFYLYTVITFVYIISKWLTHKYKLGDTAFHLYKGIFTKKEQTIPYEKIQNVNRHISVFHRIFKMTSIHFETAMSGEDTTIKFNVISLQEADQMEKVIEQGTQHDRELDDHDFGQDKLERQNDIDVEEHKEAPDEVSTLKTNAQSGRQNRVIHFNPTKRDVLKASFTSLSFLVLVPILVSLYFQLDDFFDLDERAEGLISIILSAWWLIVVIIVALVITSIIFGIVRVYLKYGKYEISSDEERVYITQGVIDERSFSISKQNVQAVEITQSLIKRLLGIVEVKLISAGNLKIDDDDLKISSLYPFLPEKRAYEMIAEILPSYEITEQMAKLPKKALWVRLLRPIWFIVLVSVALFYFQPAIWGLEQAWWIGLVLLIVVIYSFVILGYKNTKYTINDHFIQIKKGGMVTSHIVTKRDKIIEVKVFRSFFQRKLGIASFEIVNRANPVRHTELDDIPVAMAGSVYTWYMDRTKEIEIE